MVKKTSGSKPPVRGRRRVLPDDACPACGKKMAEKRGPLRLPVNGEEIRVSAASHLRCAGCDEVVLRFDDARRLTEEAVSLYRKKQGLLSADEIRGLRERFGLTQGGLARLLRLGTNTVSRWESGRNAQTAALDMLLRVIRDVPGSLDYLRSHAACIVLSDEAFDRMVAMVERPSAPTKALRKLMRGRRA